MKSLHYRDDGGYDRLAMVYPVLEWMMFGSELARARRQSCRRWIEHLPIPSRVLIVGDGRGHCLTNLALSWTDASFTCLDRSGAMLDHQRRVASTYRWTNVKFIEMNLMKQDWPGIDYDVIVLPMVLDCFAKKDVRQIIHLCRHRLRPSGTVCYLDFVQPKRWIDLCRDRCMHWFFRMTTDLPNGQLVDVHPEFIQQQFVVIDRHAFAGGFLESRLYRAGV